MTIGSRVTLFHGMSSPHLEGDSLRGMLTLSRIPRMWDLLGGLLGREDHCHST